MLFHIFAASNLDSLSKSYEKEIACGKEIVVFKKYGIPHRLDVGFPPSFSLIKRGSPSSLNYTSPLHLRLFVVLPNCFEYLLFASIS